MVVVVLVVGMVSLVLLSLLDVHLLVIDKSSGEVTALTWRVATVHGLPFVAFVLLQRDRSGSLVVVLVVVALIGMIEWILWSRWLDTGFTLLVLTQC
jgi:hypothetical protein